MPNQTTDFLLQRTQLWDNIHALLAKKSLPAAREAEQLLKGWLNEHPNDVYSQEGGEQVAMSVEAWEIMEGDIAGSRTEEFYTQRANLWNAIDLLLGEAELTKAHQARQMLQEWLRQHPNDDYSREASGTLISIEAALAGSSVQKAAELVAA